MVTYKLERPSGQELQAIKKSQQQNDHMQESTQWHASSKTAAVGRLYRYDEISFVVFGLGCLARLNITLWCCVQTSDLMTESSISSRTGSCTLQ